MSDISRRELLLDTESTKVDEASKLRGRVDEMHALKALIDMRGWKVISDYLNRKLNIDRFLMTKTAQERHEAWGAMAELSEFVSFLRKKISEGEEASKVLASKDI